MGRIAALVALGVAVVAVVLLLSGGDEPYEVTGEFENASQLVPGNEVIVGGRRGRLGQGDRARATTARPWSPSRSTMSTRR